MTITCVQTLVERANEGIETLGAQSALELCSQGEGILVDIRDIRELSREGRIGDAIHAPRGMLEFWFDPQCEYHREVFNQPDKKFVLCCAIGWRSALAAKALVDMGFDNIAHVDGGYDALKEAGATIIKDQEK